jgi:hypothetical protein
MNREQRKEGEGAFLLPSPSSLLYSYPITANQLATELPFGSLPHV